MAPKSVSAEAESLGAPIAPEMTIAVKSTALTRRYQDILFLNCLSAPDEQSNPRRDAALLRDAGRASEILTIAAPVRQKHVPRANCNPVDLRDRRRQTL